METISVKNPAHSNTDQVSFVVPIAQPVKICWSGPKLNDKLEAASFQVAQLGLNLPCEIKTNQDGTTVTATLEAHQTITNAPRGVAYVLIGCDDGRPRLLRRGLFVPQ